MDSRESLHNRMFSQKGSAIKKYKGMFIGQYDTLSLIKYELLAAFMSQVPGAFGLLLRKFSYRCLFNEVGENVIFGRHLTIRYPKKISIGNNVVIDDNCLLDAKGMANKGIVLKDNILIGRNSTLNCKEGNITVGSNTQITQDVFMEIAGGDLVIGDFVGIGTGTRIIGGHHRLRDEIDETLVPEWMITPTSSGIILHDRAFLGANVIVLDGVSIGRNTVVGAGSIVTKDLPENVVAVGIPARIIRQRNVSDSVTSDRNEPQ